MGTTLGLGPETLVGLSPPALVGMATTVVGLSPATVVGMAATLVVAAALGLGLVSRSPDQIASSRRLAQA